MKEEIRFCQRCGKELSEKRVEGTVRPFCGECGYIVYLDPKVAAVVLASRGESLVMVLRANDPAMGKWAFPSGYVDRGEAVEDAARREMKEETGLDIEITGLVGVYSTAGSPLILVVFAAEVAGGAARPGSDVRQVDFYKLSELPPLPFPHDAQMLREWKKSQGVDGQARDKNAD